MHEALHDAHSLHELADSDIVIEAALENMDLKRTIFRALGDECRSDTILASNTSALSVSEIGQASGVPDRVLGLHFFNPAPVMPLVEVVVADQTTKSVVERAVAFVEGLGKTPIVSTDAPGFIVNRVNRPFTLEALRMLEAGEAGIEQVDRAVQSGGYPMGPFALMDLVGIDVNLAVATALWEGFDEAVRFTPSDIQRERVASGRLGRKSGEGFYRYDGHQIVGLAIDAGSGGLLTDEQIVERIELAIINEAYRAAEDGVAQPPDIDRAMKLGANHPHGPFERAGELGLRRVVENLLALEKEYGERYQICRALWQVASI
jgi:3-hydroxybutyryl-CoA dehydrogenase